MSKILNANSRLILVDGDDANMIESSPTGINGVYIIPENAHLIWKSNTTDETIERDLKKDDIFIVFYNRDFGKDFVVVNSSEWLEALYNVKKKEQERKEEWAALQKPCDCEKCEAVSCDGSK